jgi:glutathione S-transferase
VIELWHEWNSVHSFKVRVVLAEKRIPWTDRSVDLLKFEHLDPDYLKLNPNGVVPTLVHDGRVVLESSIICQYLEEAFPEPALLPVHPYARAQARLWLKHFDEVVHPAVRKASFEMLYKPLLRRMPASELALRARSHPDAGRARAFIEAAAGAMDSAAVRESVMRFRETIARIDKALEEQAWLGGAAFGLADAALAPFAERLEHLRLASLWTPWPRAAQWNARVLARDSVASSRAPASRKFPAPSDDKLPW